MLQTIFLNFHQHLEEEFLFQKCKCFSCFGSDRYWSVSHRLCRSMRPTVCSYCPVNTGGCTAGLKSSSCRRSSSESGEDSDEEDHADEGEGDQDEHQPQQPVDGLLGVLLQSLRLRLQLLEVHVCLTHWLAQSLRGTGTNNWLCKCLGKCWAHMPTIQLSYSETTRLFLCRGFIGCWWILFVLYCPLKGRISWDVWHQ